MENQTLLTIEDLSVQFVSAGVRTTALSGLSLTAKKGEILAVVGASGAGKSLLAHAVLGLLPKNAEVTGRMTYKGQALNEKTLPRLRGREITLIPQAVTYLDPLMPVGRQVYYPMNKQEGRAKTAALFEEYGLSPEVMKKYPFELSGGMTRRVLFSAAVLSGAKLLLADEPTPGLSRETARHVLRHLRAFAKEGRTVLLITHDLDLAVECADRVAVLYAGTLLEIAPATDFTEDGAALRHPYSQSLWNALPQNGFHPVAGNMPSPGERVKGCPFAPRCLKKTALCWEKPVPLRPLRDGTVRCIHAT